MHAMQYEITLPADYDMGIIRHRVATRGERTDSLRGLGLKAYGIREKGVNGSPVNQYAPFYLWGTQSGMNDFLLGPGFAGLCNDFGRPAVRHWNVLTFEPGPAFGNPPRTASRSTRRLPAETSLEDAISLAMAGVAGLRRAAGMHSTALALDPLSWEFVQFTLWSDPAPDDGGIRYEVLHTSTPQLNSLPHGRQWGEAE